MGRRQEVIRMGSWGQPAPTLTLSPYNLTVDRERIFGELREFMQALGIDAEREIRALDGRAEQAIVAIR